MAKPRRHNFVVHQNLRENPWEHESTGKRGGGQKVDGIWSPLGNEAITEERDQRYVRKVRPRSDNQAQFMQAIDAHPLTIGLGPAGSGKTYLAVTAAVEAFEAGSVARIVLTRPAIEAGETLGFLPGDLEEKMAPYLRPLFDALGERLGAKRLRKMIQDGDIEIAPVAFMRGRTLNNAFVVIDEAQNCTHSQLKMLLSRLGWHSKMVVTGDPGQSDLLHGMSGLADIARQLAGIESIGICYLNEGDIVRHPLVAEIIERLK